jgi:pimeloyl-ACP methyl ester carboxylesterase
MTVRLRELDVPLDDGWSLHAYEAAPDAGPDGLTVLWHHGTPNIGSPPAPLFAASERLGIRWVGYDRPGYGGSPRRIGRDIASAAADAAAVADALGADRFAVMGHSGGGPHALACAALRPERVMAVVSGAGLAPLGSEGLDWFDGMAPAGVAALHAALEGREAKERYEASAPDGDSGFVQADLDALGAEWSWFGSVVGPALAAGPGGLVDDDLAYVAPWGFDPGRVTAPTLLIHGTDDRMVPAAHSRWLSRQVAGAELWESPGDGHVSVLRSAERALEWLRERAG